MASDAAAAAVRQGWLDKLPVSGRFLVEKKAWKRRWIILFADKICWFDDPSSDNPKGSMPLAGADAELQEAKKQGDVKARMGEWSEALSFYHQAIAALSKSTKRHSGTNIAVW